MSAEQTLANNGQHDELVLLQDGQKKALEMMEDFKRGCKLLAAEAGVDFEFTPEEAAIYARVKQLIEDFWYT